MHEEITRLVQTCPNPKTGSTHGTVLTDKDGRCWRKAAVSRAAEVAAARGPLTAYAAARARGAGRAAARGPLTAYAARVAAAHESL